MLTLNDIMARDVVAVDPDTTLRDTIALLIERRISGVPVVSGGEVKGVVSATDLLDAVAAAIRTQPAHAEAGAHEDDDAESWLADDDVEPDFFTDGWEAGVDELERFGELEEQYEAVDERTVEEVMTRALHALPSTTPLRDAARYMLETGIHRVLVVDGNALVGLATTSDFMKAVAEGRVVELQPRRPVSINGKRRAAAGRA